MHSPASPTRLTPCVAGKYIIYGHVDFDNPSTVGYRVVAIWLNGGPFVGDGVLAQTEIAANADDTAVVVTTHYELQPTDYVELVVIQNSGGPLDVRKLFQLSPEFGMVKLP